MEKLLLLGLFALSAAGCTGFVDDLAAPDSIRQRSEYAFPLVDSRVGLEELVGAVDGRFYLTVDPDGLLRFNYTDTVPAVTSQAIFTDLRELGRGVPVPITESRMTVELPLPDDASLNLLQLRAGGLTYYLPNPYPQPVRVALTLPNLQNDEGPFTISADLPAYAGTGDQPALTNNGTPLDLTGYSFRVTDNELTVEYDITGPAGLPLEPGRGTIAIFTDLDFSYLEGYFGQQPYAGVDDRLEIDFFDNYLSGTVTFVDPRIVVRIRNSVGVPARAVVEELSVITEDGRRLPVEGEVVDEGFTFDYPREPGTNAYTTYVVDKTNSNLLELLDARPSALDYRISALINPDRDTTQRGFLTDTSSFTATVTVELPLYGTATDFELSDTVRFDLDRQYEEVTAASFRVTTDNELPLDVLLTGTFIDSLGGPLTDLADGALLLVRAGTSTTTDLDVAGDRLELIRRAKYLVLETSFATTGQGSLPVRINNDQSLRVRIGARVTVEQP